MVTNSAYPDKETGSVVLNLKGEIVRLTAEQAIKISDELRLAAMGLLPKPEGCNGCGS